jgi:hypothetical protein
VSFWQSRALLYTPATDEALLRAVARVSTYSSEARYVWRGQPDLAWGLNPGLVRRLQDRKRFRSPITETLLRGHEQQLLESALARGYGRQSGHIELLAVLQHHGAATRLLDVSSDPMVAMWFAVEDEGRLGSDGVLFAINVSRARIIGGTESRTWNEILDDLDTESIAYYEPPGADERIKVQRGRFVFSRLTGNEPEELSLPISLENWTAEKRDRFFAGARDAGRPVPPSILAIRIPGKIKQRLLSLLENSYGYTSETMYPDLSGFAAANSWGRPLRRDRRPAVPLTVDVLPVAMDLGKGATWDKSVVAWDPVDVREAAERSLTISARRIRRWTKNPADAPSFWAAYHADEVIAVFTIDHTSWKSTRPGRWRCQLQPTWEPDALRLLGNTLLHDGSPIRVAGRGVFVAHLKPHI